MVFFLQWAKICDRFKSAAHAMESYWSSAHLENNQSQFVHLMPATLATQHTNDNTELSLSLYLQFFNIWNPENETKNQKKFFIVRSIWYDFSACKQKILWFSSKQLNCIQVVIEVSVVAQSDCIFTQWIRWIYLRICRDNANDLCAMRFFDCVRVRTLTLIHTACLHCHHPSSKYIQRIHCVNIQTFCFHLKFQILLAC